MSLAILTTHPIAYHAYTPVQRASVIAYAGGRPEQRAQLEDREYRDYEVVYRVHTSTRATIDAFFRALGWTKTSFLWKVPPGLAQHEGEYFRSGVSLGTSVTSQVNFPLATSGEYGGDYPVDHAATAALYDDGSEIAATVETDNRRFVAGAAPANGSVMTADYLYYRRYRLADQFQWRFLETGLWEAVLGFVEVNA